jgi:anion-transporting  ArsA/GET3 family ATPase
MTQFAPMPAARVIDELARRRWLIVSGKGGAGRSTVSALLGAELAARGRRVLVATTGHDDRLAWMLGEDGLREEATEVSPGLWIQRVVPHVCIREYAGMILKTKRLASLVFGNRVVRRMMDAVPGLDDFAILGKVWHEATRGGDYDTVIFDGPASGHLRLVLGVPRAIVESVARGPLVDEALRMVQSLRDPATTGAVLVGLPEQWPLTELDELSEALRVDVGVDVAALVVNKHWPADLPDLGAPPPDASASVLGLIETIRELRRRGHAHAAEVDAWLSTLELGPDRRGRPMFVLPAIGSGFDADALSRVREQIRNGTAMQPRGESVR